MTSDKQYSAAEVEAAFNWAIDEALEEVLEDHEPDSMKVSLNFVANAALSHLDGAASVADVLYRCYGDADLEQIGFC